MIALLKLKIMKLRDDIKMIAVMTGLTLVMIAVFSSINYSESETAYGFVDHDKSELSAMLYEKINSKDGYKLVEYTLDEAIESVKDGDVSGAFYIKEQFMDNLTDGDAVEIEKLLVSENMNNIQMDNILYSSVKSIIYDYKLADALSKAITDDNSFREEIKLFVYDTIDEHWQYKKPIEVSEWNINNVKPYDSVKHSVIGFSLFFAMFTIVFGVSEILNEKENHTWDRLMISPISKFSMLIGNLGSTFIIGFVQVSMMFVISKYAFKVDWQGSMVNTLIVVAAFVFCVTSMGMFIANFVRTIGQLSAVTPVILTGTAMLGGCFWPLEIVSSKLLLFASNITPQKWAISSLKSIVVNGYGLEEAGNGILVLLLMGMVYVTLGTLLLNKKSA